MTIGSATRIFTRIAHAAAESDLETLAQARDELGYLDLDPKGRLASFKALRRSIKAACGIDARATAYASLEAAFPVPYDALKAHVEQKTFARAVKAPTPAVALSADVEQASKLLAQSEPAGLPDGWVRLRGIDGYVDAPKSAFKAAPYFDVLVNGPMQGGHDAQGACMVDISQEMLRFVVQWCVHESLPELSKSQEEELRQVAEVKLLDGLSDYLALRAYNNSRTRFVTAEEYRNSVHEQGKQLWIQYDAAVEKAMFKAFAILLEPHVVTLQPTLAAKAEISLSDIPFGVKALPDNEFSLACSLQHDREGRGHTPLIKHTISAVKDLLKDVGCVPTGWTSSAENNTITFAYMVL